MRRFAGDKEPWPTFENRRRRIPQDWRFFVDGMVHFYDGQMEEANKDFEQSLESDDNNMAALALSAICSAWQGKWDRVFEYRKHSTPCHPEKVTNNTTKYLQFASRYLSRVGQRSCLV